ncbi:DinB family protein [Segetibacter sp. 3557_3]|uniref:DinB family protein n=1 Tax=Segetibacter sp. 3557_3 TaxID=2547429 RepID=UPI001058526A|nr:DinB family protein [Segetibacter sp. 3557_3]TDH29117.1 DinB family protein [Segetibacter sp. 3557_3]
MPKPAAGEYAVYHEAYINLVEAPDVTEAIRIYSPQINEFFNLIPENKAAFRYAPGKWSLKEMLQHIIDAERIFCYRVLTFVRKDQTPLPGFDENSYAANSNADARSWLNLLEEFQAVRKATDLLYASLNEEQLGVMSVANNYPVTANTFCFVTFGHILHHCNIIRERYLLVAESSSPIEL